MQVKLPPPTYLQPPQRGRGRGFSSVGDRGNGRDFDSSSERGHRRFNSTSATQYYARDSSSERERSLERPMDRMIRHALPQASRSAHVSPVHYAANNGSRSLLPRWESAPPQNSYVPPNPYKAQEALYGVAYNGQHNRPYQASQWPRSGGSRGGSPSRGWGPPPPRFGRY